MLIVGVVCFVWVCSALFGGTFRSYVPVTLTSDRSGLVMETGAKVKLRGVQVGRVAAVTGGNGPASLKLEIDPDQIKRIPANVEAQIRATTAFGSKYVDLIYPDHPSPQRLAAGAVLRSSNVSTEVNTVFQNLVGVLKQIEPAKLNAVLGALAEGVRGQGQRIGEATTDADQVLQAVNPRMDAVRQDFRSFAEFSQTYSAAAHDILTVLDSASTTSSTITTQASELDALLLATIGFSRAGSDLLGPTENNLIRSIDLLEPTTDLLLKYNPEYTCTLQGGLWLLQNGGWEETGGLNGYSVITDAGLLFGDDPYKYPDNLPIVAAKGGPGGKPGCGSLPDASKNFPVRYLVTNTGWGTGLDVRPNPGIGHPWWIDYFPVTRAVPEPPSIRGVKPPAIGPVPYPGAPPYGAPLYGPDGTPLYPGVPPPPPPAPEPAPAAPATGAEPPPTP
ncbi:MCE family protein [Mycobacterium sp. SMC-2]|uniref:MCE family protein n=1 Tax=Mycobacterium sp. SMC-2 TaxID=2857058 RepID=UPI0021B2078E|nr:MCE family protein [Mycobacterium sp. SMC-2]